MLELEGRINPYETVSKIDPLKFVVLIVYEFILCVYEHFIAGTASYPPEYPGICPHYQKDVPKAETVCNLEKFTCIFLCVYECGTYTTNCFSRSIPWSIVAAVQLLEDSDADIVYDLDKDCRS